jgi:hypothetical protein
MGSVMTRTKSTTDKPQPCDREKNHAEPYF